MNVIESQVRPRAPEFQARLLTNIVLKGNAEEPRTYWLDDPRFFPTAESLEADKRRTPHE